MRISDGSSDVCSSDLSANTTEPTDKLRAFLGPVRDKLKFATKLLVVLRKPLDEERLIAHLKILTSRSVLEGIGGLGLLIRSEARRVGQECVSTCRYRGSPSHETKKEDRAREEN